MQSNYENFERLFNAFSTEPYIVLKNINEPDIFDRKNLVLHLQFLGIRGTNFDIKLHRDNTCTFVHHLHKCLENFNRPIVCLDAKLFFSFCRKSGCNITPNILNFFDLKWFTGYVENHANLANLPEIHSIFCQFIKSDVNQIYKKVYQQLICSTVPQMENECIIQDDTAIALYPNYLSDFQENGRLNTCVPSSRNYNPHSMTYDIKRNLILPNDDEVFVTFDFKALELYVLAYLCNDANLNTLLYNTCHPYEQIAQFVLDLSNFNNETTKELGKKIFLPAIYGMSINKMSESLACSTNEAISYMNKMKKIFAKSFSYVEDYKEKVVNEGYCVDYFGRKKSFATADAYKAMNFCVQSPAATICFIKMNEISNIKSDKIRLLFSVHDCFVFAIKIKKIKESIISIKQKLEEEFSDLKGLRLFVDIKIGRNLANLKNFDFSLT